MHDWVRMPKGMLLKSEGLASDLSDPRRDFTLRHYCKKRGIPYADIGLPVELNTFIDYGLEFQRRFAPNLEDRQLISLAPEGAEFRLQFSDGENVTARRVVLATGVSYFKRIPIQLAGLPDTLVSHSIDNDDPARFAGRDVAIIGAGASAIDLAGLSAECGARVRLITRAPSIDIHDKMKVPRPLGERISRPMSGIGPTWRGLFYCQLPFVFRHLPDSVRVDKVKSTPRPAAGWFMKDRMRGVNLELNQHIKSAEVLDNRVILRLVRSDGTENTIDVDHVVSATGFEVDVKRLPYLARDVANSLKVVEGAPRLSANFESSIPGLYFTGPAAANTFGPVMRFAVGSKFAAGRIVRHLARTAARN
ncbi:hypothetical protein AYJ54_22025 [Bradyrhizobium centrolobii]|uniref:FAD/NAD(P)-binding domain-containing protein n=2 Tax=Bradyrhizobium centrolobii TaxID=1505087 RepID=A0A176YES9_9BRAD|nr:hypothetical protein AYJ54_22025 [Bradyrhizobium centrolobii]